MITNSTLGISDDDFSSRNKTGLVLLLPTTIFSGEFARVTNMVGFTASHGFACVSVYSYVVWG